MDFWEGRGFFYRKDYKITSLFLFSMKKILTADNTETFLNEEVGETYHSCTGAVEEALKKYAIPCKIEQLAKEKGKIRILDVCSGLGYNSAMAIDVALKANRNCEIEIVCLEKDPQIIRLIQEVNPPINNYRLIKSLVKNNPKKIKNKENITYLNQKIKINLIIGDARETVKNLEKESFDAVFFDPFSPKAAPEMWTAEVFRQMWRVMTSTAILATFTSAPEARENMAEAGLFYDDGPIMSKRGPGTVATKWE